VLPNISIVYNFETNIVEESIHINFDVKDSDNKILELVDSLIDLEISAEPETSYVSEETSHA